MEPKKSAIPPKKPPLFPGSSVAGGSLGSMGEEGSVGSVVGSVGVGSPVAGANTFPQTVQI